MKKILTILFCLMFVFGMVISCDNGESLSDEEIDKLGSVEQGLYGQDYEEVEYPFQD